MSDVGSQLHVVTCGRTAIIADYDFANDAVDVKNRKPTNPFYLLLLFAGIAFGITACAYGVMTVRQMRSGKSAAGYRYFFEEEAAGPPANFNELIDRYGATAMIWEIVLLGIGTVGAIAYDQHIDKTEVAPETQGESP